MLLRKICIVPKSPTSDRIGRKEWQDWYGILQKAAVLVADEEWKKIILSSSFKPDGENYEIDIFKSELKKMGGYKSCEKIQLEYEGCDTLSQLNNIFKLAKKEKFIPTLVCSFLHFPRIWFICRRYEIKPKYQTVLGLPRPKEFFTDFVLTFFYPIIYCLGLEKWFIKKTSERRKKGIV